MHLFYHLFDTAIVNAWLLYRKVHGNQTRLVDFRGFAAEALCKAGRSSVAKRGRPSTEVETMLEAKKHRGPTSQIPVKEVRLDRVEHFMNWKEKRQRCKLPGCKLMTHVNCSKCNVALCFNKDHNCFLTFHTE